MLMLQKTLGTYKDYDSSFYEVWSDVFIKYISIMVSLFEAMAIHFQAVVTQLYGLVLQLSKVYD